MLCCRGSQEERQVGNGWEVVATDADPQTRMVWRRDEALDCRACSTIEVQWDVVPDPDTRQAPPPGTYRIRLFGAWKQGPIAPVGTGRPIGSVNAYEGVTRPFRVE